MTGQWPFRIGTDSSGLARALRDLLASDDASDCSTLLAVARCVPAVRSVALAPPSRDATLASPEDRPRPSTSTWHRTDASAAGESVRVAVDVPGQSGRLTVTADAGTNPRELDAIVRGLAAGFGLLDQLRRQTAASARLARAAAVATTSVTETERSLRAAREHDRQRLTAAAGAAVTVPARRLSIAAAAVTSSLRADPAAPDAAALLTALDDDVEELIDEVRQAARSIHQLVLRSAGPAAALIASTADSDVHLDVVDTAARAGWESEAVSFWLVTALLRSWPRMESMRVEWLRSAESLVARLEVRGATADPLSWRREQLTLDYARFAALGGSVQSSRGDGTWTVTATLPTAMDGAALRPADELGPAVEVDPADGGSAVVATRAPMGRVRTELLAAVVLTLVSAAGADSVAAVDECRAAFDAAVRKSLVRRSGGAGAELTELVRLRLDQLRTVTARIDRARAEQLAARDRLVELRRSAVVTMDLDRQRIERDLHDGLQADLVALRVAGAVVLAVRTAGLGARWDDALDRFEAAAAQLAQRLPDVATGAIPRALADAGLVPALRARFAADPVTPTVRLASSVEVGERRYPEPIEVAAYFACLEAVSNSRKHAPGAVVEVDLTHLASALTVTVTDTGPGFGEAPVGPTPLRSIRERVATAGGTVDVSSSPAGTRVRLEFGY